MSDETQSDVVEIKVGALLSREDVENVRVAAKAVESANFDRGWSEDTTADELRDLATRLEVILEVAGM